MPDLDAAAVGIRVVSPSQGRYHGWADATSDLWQGANEAIAALCRQAPDRVVGLGMAPVQHGHEAVAALEDAVVRCGLRGVEISSHAPGPDGGRPVEPLAPHLEPFWAKAAELGSLVFVHPLGCTLDERLDPWYLATSWHAGGARSGALARDLRGACSIATPGLRLRPPTAGATTHLPRAGRPRPGEPPRQRQLR